MEALAHSQSYGLWRDGEQALTKTTDCVSVSESIALIIHLESAVLLGKLHAPAERRETRLGFISFFFKVRGGRVLS